MIPCTIRQLEVFVAAAETRHFGRTAQRLGISQPAVTKQIAALERQIGKRLFIRKRGSTPILSGDGIGFLEQARRFIAESESFSAACWADAGSAVRIASDLRLLDAVIKPWLPRFARNHTSIAVSCTPVDSAARGLDLLADGGADLFIYTLPRASNAGFPSEVLRPIEIAIYGGRPFAAMRNATAAEISELPFILPSQGTEAERVVLDALADGGVRPTRIAHRVQFSDVVRDLVIDGAGVAPLFINQTAGAVDRGDLFAFKIELPVLHRIVFRREQNVSPAVAAVERSLREVLQQ